MLDVNNFENIEEAEAAMARYRKKFALPQVPDDHPDMMLFQQDRFRRALLCLMFPSNCTETHNFFRSLREQPVWLLADEDGDAERDSAVARGANLFALSGDTKFLGDFRKNGQVEVHGRRAFSTRMFPLDKLPETLAHCQGRAQHYISQNSFNGPRKSANVLQLTSCYVDLDYYKSAAVSPATRVALADDKNALALIRDRCLTGGIDGRLLAPSQIVRSGQGLYIKWIFSDFLPAVAAPRWRACQAALVRLFKDFGADAACTDAARVFRVIGSVNSNNGNEVCLLRRRSDADELKYGKLTFDSLASALLAQQRASQVDVQATKSLSVQYRKDTARRKRQGKNGKAPRTTGSKFTGGKWADIVTTELPKLIEIRGVESMHGSMEMLVFCVLNFAKMAGEVPTQEHFERHINELGARMVANIDELRSACRASYFSGPVYKLSKQLLIERLHITDVELTQMQWLASKPGIAKKPTHNERASRSAEQQTKMQVVRDMHQSGVHLLDIARCLDVGYSTVRSWLKSGRV